MEAIATRKGNNSKGIIFQNDPNDSEKSGSNFKGKLLSVFTFF